MNLLRKLFRHHVLVTSTGKHLWLTVWWRFLYQKEKKSTIRHACWERESCKGKKLLHWPQVLALTYILKEFSFTFRMVLEPRCTPSITSTAANQTWTSLCLQFFWLFIIKTKQDQAHPSHVHGQIWLGIFWLQQHSESHFWDTLYAL